MNRHYLLAEVRRTFRNPRYLIFTLVMPLVLFVFFSATGNSSDTLGGISVAAYVMVSMATFGAMGGVFSTGGRIALERSTGWNRQLRLTSLSGRDYVISKAITGFTVAVPSLIVVFLAGAVIRGVHLAPERWLLVGVSVLLALLPIAALGIGLGYLARPDSLQAVSGGVIALMSMLGGLWIPIDSFPHWLVQIARALPMYWSAGAGRAALRGAWIGWHGVLVLAIWTVVLGALAARAYVRDTAKV
jgi:ABC-2 type transport system permease protein